MISKFLNTRPVQVKSPRMTPFGKANFNGGLNTNSSIEDMATNQSPYLRNIRNAHVGSIGNKLGAGFYSVPAGEAANLAQTSVTGAVDKTISSTSWIATKFIPSASGALTSLALNLKAASSSTTAPVIIELHVDSSGTPGSTVLATTSIPATKFSTSYQYLTARFIEAPSVTSGTTYWIVAYQQPNGASGSYLWSSSTTYTTAYTSANSGVTWTAGSTFGMNFQTSIAILGTVQNRGIRFTTTAGTKYSVVAFKEAAGTTAVGWINDVTGALTTIKGGLSSFATLYTFDTVMGQLWWANGKDLPSYWDGSGVTTLTTQLSTPFPGYVPQHIKFHKNRTFLLDVNGQAVYSDPATYTSYQSTSFFYVPIPNSGDAPISMFEFQDQLWFGTRRTKYSLYGSDASSFVLRQSTAVKGMISPTGWWVDGNYLYFIGYDGIYSCNGATDDLISKDITPTILAQTLTNASLVVYKNNVRVYFAESGQAKPNAMLIFDLINGGWGYDDYCYVQNAFIRNATGDSFDLVEQSSVVGAAYLAEQQASNLGRPITYVFYDRPEAYGNPGLFKQIPFFYPRFVGQSGSYQVQLWVDFDLQNSGPTSTNIQSLQGSGPIWGTFIWGSATWGATNFLEPTITLGGEHRWYQVRIQLTGADTPWEFTGYNQEVLVSLPR